MNPMKWAILPLIFFSVFLSSWGDPLLIETPAREKGFTISMAEEDEREPFSGEFPLGTLIGYHLLLHFQGWIPSSSTGPSARPLFLKFNFLRC